MAEPTTTQDEVRILPPDQTLQKKLGGVKLDTLFSAEAVQEAQEVIVASADDFWTESLADLKTLEKSVGLLSQAPQQNAQTLATIITASFSIKAKAGLGGYTLVSILANSLHSRCELLGEASFTPANRSIIQWHVESMKKLLSAKVIGNGGSIGEAILVELNTLAAAIGQTPPAHKGADEIRT